MYPKATKVCSNMGRICELPDDLLVTILSFVPTKDVVATSVLSKRWLHVWKLALNLDHDCVELCAICSLDCFSFIPMHTPKLRLLRFKQQRCCCDLLREKWKRPDLIPECLNSSVEAVEWIGYKGREETEEKVAVHILRNADNLKTMDITSSTSNTFEENTLIVSNFDLVPTKSIHEKEKDGVSTLLYNLRYHSGEMNNHFQPSDRRHQLIEACMSTILVALETRQFNAVREWTPLQHEYYNQRNDYRFKLDCASSLADLGERNYYSAAQGFLKLVKDVDKYDYSEVLSSEDIITYGLVCAMATFDRAKLQGALRKVMEPVGVVHHLKEIIKPFGVVFYLTEIIKHFLEERFTTCIELFEKQRPRLLLDLYLFGHVEFLFTEINDVMVAGYLQSFSMIMVDNYTMGFVDPKNENEVSRIILDSGGLVVPESQVIRLIQSNKIKGRIVVNQSSGRKFLHLSTQRQ